MVADGVLEYVKINGAFIEHGRKQIPYSHLKLDENHSHPLLDEIKNSFETLTSGSNL